MTTVLTEWVVSSSALIFVVLLLRGLLGKRISAGLRYALWAVVLVRLLVPVSLFAVTVPQLPKWTPPETMREENIYVLPVYSGPVESSDVHIAEDGKLGDPNSFGYARLEDEGRTITRYAEKISPLELVGWVWAAGSAVFALVLLAANLRFSIRLRRVRRPLASCGAPIPVYAASALPSPCLMGLLRPAVYVTEEAAADPVMLRHVLAHELTHYNHLDHLWSVLRGAALAAHWWNPLVWLAVVCSRRDGELACDEGALKRLGDGERTAYGETLLAMVTAKARPVDLLSFATTMSGGKRSLKERIQRIARQPKTLVSAMVIVIAVLTLSALVAFGQAKEETYGGVLVDPAADDARLGDAWKTAEVAVDEEGVPHIRYTLSDGGEETWNGSPIPAPREWAGEDLAGRDKAEYLICDPDGYPEIRAKLVSETDGWLVATYGRGVAAADTYVYKTSDRGITWNEVTMPGTSWHIADVGFLSPDRLIVAQRLFSDAPCLITKDGGETWEEIELPDQMVTAIHSETVTMFVGPNEKDRETYVMTSEDLGDHWTVVPIGPSPFMQTDLDHDGIPDMLALRKTADSGLTLWTLEFTASNMSAPTWEDEAVTAHAGWTSFFLCRMEGEDYLLQYTPYMGGGGCYYSYKLFYLTASGEEVVVQENSVDFDLIFDSGYEHLHQYDPAAINTFMEEINTLLAHSEQLVNTDENLLGTFQREGRLYDSVWWLDDDRDENKSLLENLILYRDKALGVSKDQTSDMALTADLDRDGVSEILDASRSGEVPVYTLRVIQNGEVLWSDTLDESHGNCNTYFLYQENGLDYLLEYTPKMQQGTCTYFYRLFHLENGREVTDQENSMEFDINFTAQYHQFDPAAIAAFMQEVNGLIGSSQLLLNTNYWMLNLEEDGSGRLRDNILVSLNYHESRDYNTEADLRTALEAYDSYAEDHPDDTWSPLADLLLELTEEDIPMFDGDTAELVRLLQSAERGSRFYTWGSETDAYIGAGAEEVDYTIWNLPLANGSTLWLLASEERNSVLMIYETPEETVSAFYDAPELKEWILDVEAANN